MICIGLVLELRLLICRLSLTLMLKSVNDYSEKNMMKKSSGYFFVLLFFLWNPFKDSKNLTKKLGIKLSFGAQYGSFRLVNHLALNKNNPLLVQRWGHQTQLRMLWFLIHILVGSNLNVHFVSDVHSIVANFNDKKSHNWYFKIFTYRDYYLSKLPFIWMVWTMIFLNSFFY